MPRAYMAADARCRQLERLVRKYPGKTVDQLAEFASIGRRAARAYLLRLRREKSVVAVIEEPATPRGALQRFYPPPPPVEVKAA